MCIFCASLMCLRKYTMLVSWYTRWRDGERMCSWFALHVYRCVYWRYESASSWTCSTLAVMLHGCRSLVQEAFLLYAFLCMEHSVVLGTDYTSALCILQVISTMCKLCMSIWSMIHVPVLWYLVCGFEDTTQHCFTWTPIALFWE